MVWLFMFWMLLASSLGFLKLIALAFMLDASDYGQYVAIFGLATLAGAIASFGLVERTIKLYPRQWAEGKLSKILDDAKAVLKALLMRFALVAVVGVAIAATGAVPFNWIQVASVCLLGLGSAWLSLFASLYRAAGSRKALQNFSLWRSGLAVLLALIGGWALGWVGALGGDILASVLTSILAIGSLRKLYAQAKKEIQTLELSGDQINESGHGSLYVANMFTASTTMADRSVIGATLGASAAGAYGVIMLLPQVSQMLVNVVAQYIGPLIIKFAHLRHQDKSRISALGLQTILLGSLAALCVVAALIGKHLTFVDALIAKFFISDISLILAGMIAAGQIYGVIEYHLIAHDGERFVLVASVISGGLFFLLFAVVAYQSLAMEYFVGAAAIARWLQVGILAWALMRVKNKA